MTGRARCLVCSGISLCLLVTFILSAAAVEPGESFWPVGDDWLSQGRIVEGPPDVKGKTIGELPQWFALAADGQSLTVTDDAPNGRYDVRWAVPRPEGVQAVTVSASLYKANRNQGNGISACNAGDSDWTALGGNTKDWQWQDVGGDLWPLALDQGQPIEVRWGFNKPHQGHVWHVRFGKLSVAAADPAKAMAGFRQPLAEGLPPLADPARARKAWTSRLEVKDGMMFKDGRPFLAMGFVGGADPKGLAQARAMGCTAVSIDLGWWAAPAPGPVPEESFDSVIRTLRRIGEWDMASFVLLVGHYVPGWFRAAHEGMLCPLGSDGEQTGHWMPYSLHYEPFREAIVPFWQGAARELVKVPSLMAINFWNEPCYGGAWAWPTQFGDYQPFAINDYREHLRKAYGTVAALRAAHRQEYESFEGVDPPKAPEEQTRQAWLDWMEYGQQYFADFFRWEGEVIRAAAPAVRLANKKQTNPWDNSTASSGTNWHLLAQSEDIFGLNIYWASPVGIRDIIEAAGCYADGRPVICFETNCMPPRGMVSPDTARVQLWAYMLAGIDGIFIYAFNEDGTGHGLVPADRDDPKNEVRPETRPEYVRFFRSVAAHQRELASPHEAARVAVIYSTTGALQYTHNRIPRYMTGAYDLFRHSHFQADVLPEERCTAKEMRKYELIVLPSYCILKAPGIAALNEYARSGGRILAFGKSLAVDEFLEPVDPPAVLGVETRKPPIAGNTSQPIVKLDPTLQPYVEGEPNVTGVELISQLDEAAMKWIQGEELKSAVSGKVMALNKDGYPAVTVAPGGQIVYCAFDSDYSAPVRGVVEGIAREVFGITQQARLLRDGTVEPNVMISLRRDYADSNRRYLMAINLLHKPRRLAVDLAPGWTVVREHFHDLEADIVDGMSEVRLAPREVYLWTLSLGGDELSGTE